MSKITVDSEAERQAPTGSGPSGTPAAGPGPVAILGLAAWLGLLAGFAELAAFLAFRGSSGDTSEYIGKIRQYPWLIPPVDAGLFFLGSLPIAALAALGVGVVRRMAPRLLVTAALMPPLLALAPEVYAAALLLLAAGIASVLTPIGSRRPVAVGRVVRITFPVMLLAVAGIAAWRELPVGGPAAAEEASSGGRPNVLLVVLDTVRADHLRINDSGYHRPTSPRLDELADRGVSFRGAHATAPWTLPSHATLFTGRWPFEVCEGRYGAMQAETTLAGVLSEEGYDTVGISANIFFATYFTGLAQGFSHFEDLPATPSTVVACTEVGRRLVDLAEGLWKRRRPGETSPIRRYPRVDADRVNRRFLGWLDRRPDEERPFFAFLNYFDAHDPYVVPAGAEHRFGPPPESSEARQFLDDWWANTEKVETPQEQLDRLVEGYDSCIAYIDDRLGRLLDELDRRGILDETIVVVTSDHGEAFGEHDLFGHGISLYEDQLHVPLVISAPGRVPEGIETDEVVSLRDLPATILGLAGLPDAPLPGTSLAPLWRLQADPEQEGNQAEIPRSPAIASVPGPDRFPPNFGRSPTFRGAMISLLDENALKYIYTYAGAFAGEELYSLEDDPGEEANLASPFSQSLLMRYRGALNEVLRAAGASPGAGDGGPPP